MSSSIENYLSVLKAEMDGSDVATIQDALADAEDHLRSAFESLHIDQPGMDTESVLQDIIEQYGSPAETAAAYKEVERRTSPSLVRQANLPSQPMLVRFFGIYADPKAWGALVYLSISIITGIIYFTWVMTGISLTLGLTILIIGLPFSALFLLSIRAVALLEGRMVEALLGVRMPRRSVFAPQNVNWLERLKTQALDKQTWRIIGYMLMQMPLGVLYFTILSTAFALSLGFISLPILQTVLKMPLLSIGNQTYYVPGVALPFIVAWGVCLWTSIMHLIRFIGQLHGRFAKFMMVAE